MKNITFDMLTPVQKRACSELQYALEVGHSVILHGRTGMGKTAVLNALRGEAGGQHLDTARLLETLQHTSPFAIEEMFFKIVREAMDESPLVLIDDLNLLLDVVSQCGFNNYPRTDWISAVLVNLVQEAETEEKKLVFAASGEVPQAHRLRSYNITIEKFSEKDYEALCRPFLSAEQASQLDYARIYSFAPKLNGHQLRTSSLFLKREEGLDTERFLKYLRSQEMASNVDLGEVQQVDLKSLKGLDDIIEALEANIILPLENDALARELNIRPKRGVMLAGPPGTGKTTIGRALAWRLQSKFFLIDGTIISGTSNFYNQVQQIFETAKQNAPAIIFIDDSDVIFEDSEQAGLYRYLLTMLDGLESISAGRICVMMTAMNVAQLPPALIRSGRIELWLETRLPDIEARSAILEEQAALLPEAWKDLDRERIANATEGLTGADLKRTGEDALLLYAYDLSRGAEILSSTDYFLKAAATVQEHKERYVKAAEAARNHNSARPPWFSIAEKEEAFSRDDEN